MLKSKIVHGFRLLTDSNSCGVPTLFTESNYLSQPDIEIRTEIGV